MTISSVAREVIKPAGQVRCDIEVQGYAIRDLPVLVLPHLPCGSSILLGIDIVKKIGSLSLRADSQGNVKAKFNSGQIVLSAVEAATWVIEDQDFVAKFDGEHWEVAWKWKGDPPVLQNRKAQYTIGSDIKDAYDQEIQRWIAEGWLVPCSAPQGGIVPMLAVNQENKGKVRPVLDYQELNASVQSNTANSEVCPETLKRWRLMGDWLGVVDLKNAYLQLHVRRDLQDFQVVQS